MNYSQLEVAALLKENDPIAVCDGTEMPRLPFFGQCFLSWLKFNEFKASVEDNLYTRENFDLSKYKTIAFCTQGEEKLRSSFEKIIKSFSKDNLKVVIIGNEVSYFRIKNIAEMLGIKLIGFDYFKPMMVLNKMQETFTTVKVTLEDVWGMDDYTGLFFDVKQFG